MSEVLRFALVHLFHFLSHLHDNNHLTRISGAPYPSWAADSSNGFVRSSLWSCGPGAVCYQNLTRTVSIPQYNSPIIQPNSYVEFSYRGYGTSDYYYYWYGSNQLYLTVKYDGVVKQVFPGISESWRYGEAVEDWTIFRYPFPACKTQTSDQKCVYEITWSFIIRGTAYYYNAAGAAIDSILIVGTQGNSPTCNACPAGSCSPSGSLGCTLCPLGSFSTLSGALTCSACSGPLPDRARYTRLGDTAPTCQLTCGPGYQLSLSQKLCVPNPDLCYLPSRDRVMDSNHYYPTSLSMLSQCLQYGYQVSPSVMQKTIDSVIEMVSQYSNFTNTFLASLVAIQKNAVSGYHNLSVQVRASQRALFNFTFSGMLSNPTLCLHLRPRTMLSSSTSPVCFYSTWLSIFPSTSTCLSILKPISAPSTSPT